MTAIKRVATVSGVFFIESMSKTSGEVSAFHELIELATPDSCLAAEKLVNIVP
jgi:hypothetical protein